MAHKQTIDNQIISSYLGVLSDKEKKAVLTVVKTFAENETDIWDEMPDEIRAAVKEGIAESDKSLGEPHAEVMKTYAKWLKK